MKSISQTCLFIGGMLLFTLLLLRLAWPEAVVGARSGGALSLSGSFFVFLGLGLGLGLKIQPGAIGGALVWASTALLAGTINFVFDLEFFNEHPAVQSVEHFFALATPLMLGMWGVALWRFRRKRLSDSPGEP